MKRVWFLIGTIIIATAAALAQQTPDPAKPQNQTGRQSLNIEALVNLYFDSLNEPGAQRRRALTNQVWAERGKFGTPYAEVEGHDAIANLVADVQKRFPNSTVRRTTRIDGFGDYWRWGFTLSEADGAPILSGIDFAIIKNGKLQLVMGFFDFAPNNVNARPLR